MSYPEFRAAFGSSVPDYRGMFLRGLGGDSGNLGIEQKGQIAGHKHEMGKWRNQASYYVVAPFDKLGAFYPSSVNFANYGVAGSTASSTPDHIVYTDEKPIISESIENRPVNKAVKYIIKVR